MRTRFIAASLLAIALGTAQAAPNADSKKPIEIASDNLEVFQAENKAIFSGNVIAKQGDTTMRSKTMTVFYTGNALAPDAGKTPAATTTPAPAPDAGKGIQRIEAEGGVVFTTLEETAQGDKGIYNTQNNTIDLMGNVVLTRGQNVLKGSALNYNLTTGRSLLSGGRVHGLFVPGDK